VRRREGLSGQVTRPEVPYLDDARSTAAVGHGGVLREGECGAPPGRLRRGLCPHHSHRRQVDGGDPAVAGHHQGCPGTLQVGLCEASRDDGSAFRVGQVRVEDPHVSATIGRDKGAVRGEEGGAAVEGAAVPTLHVVAALDLGRELRLQGVRVQPCNLAGFGAYDRHPRSVVADGEVADAEWHRAGPEDRLAGAQVEDGELETEHLPGPARRQVVLHHDAEGAVPADRHLRSGESRRRARQDPLRGTGAQVHHRDRLLRRELRTVVQHECR